MKPIIFLCLIISCVGVKAGNCGSGNCAADDLCCDDIIAGYQCYDPNLYVCLSNPNMLCPFGESACGVACYEPSQYHCTNGVLEQGPEICDVFTTSSACTAAGSPCAWCSNYYIDTSYGFCYNSQTETCCGQYADDCYTPTACNVTSQLCCLPLYGCEYAGSPVCCQAAQSCCAGIHNVACCASTQSCCANFYYGVCCDESSVCCGQDATELSNPYCCPSGTSCGSSGNCV